MFDIPKIKNFLPRGVTIQSRKTYIYGSPHSGKTSLALAYAAKMRRAYYINFAFLFSQDSYKHVRNFLLTLPSETELLIIDNFSTGFIDDICIEVPCIYIGKQAECPKDFQKLRLLSLSFEEYLGFDKKNLSVETLLSNFIKDGNNPEIYFLADYKKRERKLQILQLALCDDFLPFCHMLALQSQRVSTMSIYRYLKANIKISKDRIYQLIESFVQNQIIHICKHIDDVNDSGNKKYKIYFYDFSLSELIFAKNFGRVYENMIFLELLAMGFTLTYSDLCDFIDEKKKMIFLCTPFLSVEQIQKRIHYVQRYEKKLSDFLIVAISMNINYQINEHILIIDFMSLSPRFHI